MESSKKLLILHAYHEYWPHPHSKQVLIDESDQKIKSKLDSVRKATWRGGSDEERNSDRGDLPFPEQ